jgi:hypothetical protein
MALKYVSCFSRLYIIQEDLMKNLCKFFSFIAFVAIIVFSMSACSDSGSSKTNYTISITQESGGVVSTNPSGKATDGTVVMVAAVPNEGFKLDSISVKRANGADVAVSNNTFTMPASNVTVSAAFSLIQPDGEEQGFQFGIISGSNIFTMAQDGTTYTITATADNTFTDFKWYIDSVLVAGANGNVLVITAAELTTGSHTVTVEAKKDGMPYASTVFYSIH